MVTLRYTQVHNISVKVRKVFYSEYKTMIDIHSSVTYVSSLSYYKN